MFARLFTVSSSGDFTGTRLAPPATESVGAADFSLSLKLPIGPQHAERLTKTFTHHTVLLKGGAGRAPAQSLRWLRISRWKPQIADPN